MPKLSCQNKKIALNKKLRAIPFNGNILMCLLLMFYNTFSTVT
jgi:hypothetical protein